MKTLLQIFFAVVIMQQSYAQSSTYYRHMLMNHMTPRMELKGLYPISSVTADGVAHYKFSYDEQGRITEIINSHPDARGEHPLANIGAYRVTLDYADSKETRTYFDKKNKRVQNLRKVYKEVYTYDDEGFKTGLSYYDKHDKAIESSWNVARYEWSKVGELVLEKRYDLNGDPQVLAPFFTLGSTLIEYGDNGLITAQYNLDEQQNKAAHALGMASYHDIHDEHGNVVLILYRDIEAKLIKAADGEFATILLVRDRFGNVLESLAIGEKGEEVWHTINTYDDKGNPLKN